MNEKELERLKQTHPLIYAVKMYRLNPIDSWKEEIRKLYMSIPEDERRYCMGDMDSKDFEIKFILGLI